LEDDISVIFHGKFALRVFDKKLIWQKRAHGQGG
jgi:hypothetical protein